MTTNRFPYADGVDREVVVDSTPEEPMIPTQRGAPASQPVAPKGGEQKPILAPWTRDRAEFIGKVRDVGKRAAHTVGWRLLHVLPNALRVLWFALVGLAFVIVGPGGGYSIWSTTHGARELSNEDYFKKKCPPVQQRWLACRESHADT